MPRTKSLSSLLRSAINPSSSSSYTETITLSSPLNQSVSSLDTSPSSVYPPKRSKLLKLQPSSKPEKSSPSSSPVTLSSLFNTPASGSGRTSGLTHKISSILYNEPTESLAELKEESDSKLLDKTPDSVLSIPWFSNLLNEKRSMQRKEVSRVRKQKWVFKSTQGDRFSRLVNMCAQKLGTDTTMQVFGKLGRETGIKEYNAFINVCLDEARKTNNEDVALKKISQTYQILRTMKEQGFQVEDGTFGPILMYFIDMCMVEEFHFFSDFVKEGNPGSIPRLGYYGMLLYIGVDDEEKVQALCDVITHGDGDEALRENYLLALCESDRGDDVKRILESISITRVSSLNNLVSIFKSLGRLMLESFVEKFLMNLKGQDFEEKNLSTLILSYSTSIPNLVVENVVSTFKNLHLKLEITPSLASYKKLIIHCCVLKVHVALDIVEEICKAGLAVSIDSLHMIMRVSEENHEFNLVRRVYSLIRDHDLKPNSETYRSMISLCVKMKDFSGAYRLLEDLKNLKLTPTAAMYNSIMGGYFREKDTTSALLVLEQMELADVKPDSRTYGYLVTNCDTEQKIIKYCEEMKKAGIAASKQVFMSLINAYASHGLFEKAKEVLLDEEIPIKNLVEIKSTLVQALAANGQISDALCLYEEIKESGNNLEPKAIVALIEYFDYQGDPNKLLKLLEELHDPQYWADGCFRVILFCVRSKHLSLVVDLLKQLKNRFYNDEEAIEGLFDEVFSVIAESESTLLKFGLELLQLIKSEFAVSPSRKVLDFLLNACVKAKDLKSSLLIWQAYHEAGLPYNVLSYLRMYQALLASGSHKTASIMLKNIPRDDDHVRIVIKACQKKYNVPVKRKIKRRKSKKD